MAIDYTGGLSDDREFLLAAQPDDPEGPNHDPLAVVSEGPVHEVALAPFFLAKHEMTMGQWERFTGSNPSLYPPPLAPGVHVIADFAR